MTTATHIPPTLRAHEDADELVVEIELPADNADGFELDVDQSLLTVKVPRPPVERDEWRIHADATPC
jgi:HSP20 family molecular chaperone IbpA